MLQDTLQHLAALVGFDTRNPPRHMDEEGIFAWLRGALPGFSFEMHNAGAGAVSLHAVRGNPRILFNVHLDTVPDSPKWTQNPFELKVTDTRAVGLGACDIKGAAAAMVATAQAVEGDVAFLFSNDEEANDARCIDAFLKHKLPYDCVIVAEPTQGKAVTAHRGISSARVAFSAEAGHASNAHNPSAVHQAIRWGQACLDHMDTLRDDTFVGLQGTRFNIGKMEGGIKGNVIAPSAELRFGLRPLPSQSTDALHAYFRTLAGDAAEYEELFRGPSLPEGEDSAAKLQRVDARVTALGLPAGAPVDFWTEASLFSRAGYDTFVFGPGNIAQAHSADEWVALEELSNYAAHIARILEGTRA